MAIIEKNIVQATSNLEILDLQDIPMRSLLNVFFYKSKSTKIFIDPSLR